MRSTHVKTAPPWLDETGPPFPCLERDLETDVLVIGGGITGVTAAYLLRKAGKTVVLVERNQIGQGETGHTTAHISYPTDIRLTELVRRFGRNHAQAAWDAGCAAAEQIATNVSAESIACELQRVPGYLFAAQDADASEPDRLRQEAELARELGFDASYASSVPIGNAPGIRFSNLMKFHPQKYLLALARVIPGEGSGVFEQSSVTEFQDKPRRVICNGYSLSYQQVFIATHVPLQGLTGTVSAALLQTKVAAYSTYAISARVPQGSLPEALLWDTADPYLYLRVDRGLDCDHLIVGGADHKTGQEPNAGRSYASLEERLHNYAPQAQIERLWSGQVIEPVDGLPYIGETDENQFVATGFSGTGMTFGTLGAMMFRDHLLGTPNPWRDLMSVGRKQLSSSWDYLKENKDYPYYLLKGMLTGSSPEQLSSIRRGQGELLCYEGEKVAVYRDEGGDLTMLSPICPHLGCVVAWNEAEKTWDCPCHGSRFTAKGEVMAGPAEKPLEKW